MNQNLAISQVPRRIASVLSRLLRRDCVSGVEEREAELHLYAVSPESRLYLHLQSAWNSCIIVSRGTRRDAVLQKRPKISNSLIGLSWTCTMHNKLMSLKWAWFLFWFRWFKPH